MFELYGLPLLSGALVFNAYLIYYWTVILVNSFLIHVSGSLDTKLSSSRLESYLFKFGSVVVNIACFSTSCYSLARLPLDS
jgi:hypothetical protein